MTPLFEDFPSMDKYIYIFIQIKVLYGGTLNYSPIIPFKIQPSFFRISR